MNRSDLVTLIRDGVEGPGGVWADLGAGTGAFTGALAEVLGPTAQLIAVDKDRSALARLSAPARTIAADFTQPLDLPPLDGVLMANSLHFLRHKEPVLSLVHGYLKPGGRLLVVEYDVDSGNPWVPHPFGFETWKRLAVENGFSEPALLGRHPSQWLRGLYSAVSVRQ